MNTLILYAQKENVLQFLPELEILLQSYNINFSSFIIHPKNHFSLEKKEKILSLLPTIDFIICLGGDGTVLSTAQIIYPFNIPILPINFGQLGFISEGTEPANMKIILDEIFNKTIIQEKRSLIEITTLQKDTPSVWIALNEAYVGSNRNHKVANFIISINGDIISQYRADGVLLSTATGSTGYNLSAGGPIIDPSLDVFVLTSVVPHKLTHRPLVISSQLEVKIQLSNEFEQNLIIDGEHTANIAPSDCITMTKSKHTLTLLYPTQRNYFKALKEKLNWLV